MTWETVSVWEVLLLLAAVVGMAAAVVGLRGSLCDLRELVGRGQNGSRRLLVRGHIRGHVARLIVNGVVVAFAVFLLGRMANPADTVAPRLVAGALLVTLTLTVDSLLSARDWRTLEEE